MPVFELLCAVLAVYFSLCFVGLGRCVVFSGCPVEYVVCVEIRVVVVSPEVELSVVGNSCVVVVSPEVELSVVGNSCVVVAEIK